VVHGVSHEPRIERAEGSRVLEHEVGSPFGLVGRPVYSPWATARRWRCGAD
jgi:hypothetical protein